MAIFLRGFPKRVRHEYHGTSPDRAVPVPIYILGVIFGPEHITWYMVWMEIFRIFVAATLCYWYLSEFDFSEKSKLIATVIYAFNSYMRVWGQHYALEVL